MDMKTQVAEIYALLPKIEGLLARIEMLEKPVEKKDDSALSDKVKSLELQFDSLRNTYGQSISTYQQAINKELSKVRECIAPKASALCDEDIELISSLAIKVSDLSCAVENMNSPGKASDINAKALAEIESLKFQFDSLRNTYGQEISVYQQKINKRLKKLEASKDGE